MTMDESRVIYKYVFQIRFEKPKQGNLVNRSDELVSSERVPLLKFDE